ncbi:hypothetical protein D3C72_2385870 [compost metagenome]
MSSVEDRLGVCWRSNSMSAIAKPNSTLAVSSVVKVAGARLSAPSSARHSGMPM